MKKTLGMVFFLTVLAGMAGCGQKNTANTMEQTDTQTEKTLEEHFFSAEQDEQNYNVMEEYSEDEEYPELALVHSNLETLCIRCHNKKEGRFFQRKPNKWAHDECW